MSEPVYEPIVAFCKNLLAAHGDTPEGMGWTEAGARAHYDVMLGVMRPSPSPSPCTLIDLGCGTGRLLDYIRKAGRTDIAYRGLDLSEDALQVARDKHPHTPFERVDVLAPQAEWPRADYVVMNGVLTYKGPASQAQMFDYARRLIGTAFDHADVGIAFNVITKQVDWEREDLFHVPMDELVTFLSREVSRHVVLRADYGIYEYTVYVYREPTGTHPPGVKRLVGQAA